MRAAVIEVGHYDVSLDVTCGEETFRSVTRVEFECREPGADTFVELAAARLRDVRLNGAAVDTGGWSAERGLVLTGLAERNTLVVDADFAYTTIGQGLHRGVDPADGEVYLYSQFEIADAQRVFACFDQPDLKAEFTFHVTAPAHWAVVSNMPVGHRDGLTRHFARSPRMSTYVAAVCAGPYHEVRREFDGVDLGLFIRASMREHLDAEDLFEVTTQGFEFFHRQFGVRYPLPKYDQVFVAECNGAAMENYGCVTLGEEYFIFRGAATGFEYEKRANHMQHELAHMWFGNLVTMRWWDDIWLKEAFAEWASHWCNAENTRFTDAWTTFLSIRKNWAYRQDQLSSTHPVYAAAPDVAAAEANFDGITYAKGASVIKLLVAFVGLPAFLQGLRLYFRKHAFGNATFDDLLGALEESAGRPLRGFAEQWLRTSEVNTLRPVLTLADDGTYASVAIAQSAPPGHPLRTHRLAVGLYGADGRRRERAELTVDGPLTPVPQLAGAEVADLLLVNDDDLTYAKVRLDPRSTRTVLDRLSTLESSLARGLCWAAAWDMTRDGELPAREYVRLVARAMPDETDVNLLTSVLVPTSPAPAKSGQAQIALDRFADPGWAPRGRRELAATALAALESGAAPAAAWARAFVSVARTPDELAVLRGWLAGAGVPRDLTVDADLRWTILQALVAEGAAGPSDIDAELARDRTAGGERAAATARALVPTESSKAAVWRRLTEESLPAGLQRALLFGLHHPSQVGLTSPYHGKYLDVVGRVWAGHEIGRATEFAVYGYASLLVEPAAVEAADAWLEGAAHAGHPEPLVRLVRDGRDNQARALAARGADAAA
ncbi:aminopeptidase N [Dactylosporangium salmoneum]|uniref:Aminopeptidase N n=1 Tax=Dactylosporangium salmoneum TaxID=53361 RepID=A0ABP5V7N0_9ACTN